MKISAKAGAHVLEVTIERSNGHYVVEVDGVRHEVDAHKLEADFYSLLAGGRSYGCRSRRAVMPTTCATERRSRWSR